MAEELHELQKANQKSKLLVIAGIVAIAIVVIIFALGGDSDPMEYSLGSPCEKDCGRYRLDGWICLSDAKYCTRPCGGIHKACPTDAEADGVKYDCRAVEGIQPREEGDEVPNYCIKIE